MGLSEAIWSSTNPESAGYWLQAAASSTLELKAVRGGQDGGAPADEFASKEGRGAHLAAGPGRPRHPSLQPGACDGDVRGGARVCGMR